MRRLDQPNALAVAADREQPQTPLLGRRHHRVGMLVIDIDHGGAARLDQVAEQPQLGGEIGLECRMIVEMIAADIGEAAGRDPHAVEPVLVEAVRGRLDREMRDALVGELGERACSATGSGVVSEP